MAVGSQTSSLARYATARSPGQDLYNGSPSRDFCNSFWGTGDAGVNIMFTRMKGGAKTTEELIEFWKERSAIEEEYATRLMRLSKIALGAEEIGEMRTSIDTLRLETQVQANLHAQLASQFRKELEVACQNFHEKQTKHLQEVLVPVERKFRIKQQYESYVSKAREKYETDCLRIASYSQQVEYTTGKDLERLQTKLKRAQQTVQANEKDLINFTNNVAELLPDWEREWKDFCDLSQDLEEMRLAYMKDLLWAYANGVSTLCVADDQSCERIRTALDQLEPERDTLNFVQEYGTGNSIPDAPVFVPFTGPPPDPTHASVPAHTGLAPQTFHIAQYARISTREASYPDAGDDAQGQGQVPPPAQDLGDMPYLPNPNPSSPRDSINGATGAASIRSAQSRSEMGHAHPPGTSASPPIATSASPPIPGPSNTSPVVGPAAVGAGIPPHANNVPSTVPVSVSPPPIPQASIPISPSIPNEPAPSYPPDPYDPHYYSVGAPAPAPVASSSGTHNARINGNTGQSHAPSSYQHVGSSQPSSSSGGAGLSGGPPTRQLSQRHGQALPVPGSGSASASASTSASPSTQSPPAMPVPTPQMLQQQQQTLMVEQPHMLQHSQSQHSLYSQHSQVVSQLQQQQQHQQQQQPSHQQQQYQQPQAQGQGQAQRQQYSQQQQGQGQGQSHGQVQQVQGQEQEQERRRSIEEQYAAGSQAPVLFYVKALYDYTATIDEEFDFQVGDVIAVTATPEDGWWSGMLLDENRRIEGKHVFPSNFVCLF
ncbi:hypothetical protein AX16_001313 [Volvariella volvacea WC 439]|nr:hypothetical protein AX16_001313 [Volvariella volvacea WC 439]